MRTLCSCFRGPWPCALIREAWILAWFQLQDVWDDVALPLLDWEYLLVCNNLYKADFLCLSHLVNLHIQQMLVEQSLYIQLSRLPQNPNHRFAVNPTLPMFKWNLHTSIWSCCALLSCLPWCHWSLNKRPYHSAHARCTLIELSCLWEQYW